MNLFCSVYVNFIEKIFILIVKPIALKQQIQLSFLLFGYEHPLSQQLRITLHSCTLELLNVSVSALTWFLSFVHIPN